MRPKHSYKTSSDLSHQSVLAFYLENSNLLLKAEDEHKTPSVELSFRKIGS